MRNVESVSAVVLQIQADINQYIKETAGMNKEQFARKASIGSSTLVNILNFREGGKPLNVTLMTLEKINKAMSD